MLDLDACGERSRELVTFADGLDDAGMHDSARRLRLASYDVAELISWLRAERSARVAMQAKYQRCLDVLTLRACPACTARATSVPAEAVDE